MPPESPVPFTVVGGYLGAGKTTLINRIISRRPLPGLVVIVNDFGSLSIDAEVLARADGITLSLANGCVCCSAASGLFTALNTALDLQPAPRRILLEASGVADPARVAAVARAEPDLRPGGIYTVVNCATLRRELDDPFMANDLKRQIESADAVLLSRTDSDQAAVARELVRVLAPAAPAIDVSVISSFDELTRLSATEHGGNPVVLDPEENIPAGARYRTSTWRGPFLRDWSAFVDALRRLPSPILRLKGIVRLDDDDAYHLLNVAGDEIRIESIDARPGWFDSVITVVTRSRDAMAVESLVRRHLEPERGTRD